jgi:hypothetical protein
MSKIECFEPVTRETKWPLFMLVYPPASQRREWERFQLEAKTHVPPQLCQPPPVMTKCLRYTYFKAFFWTIINPVEKIKNHLKDSIKRYVCHVASLINKKFLWKKLSIFANFSKRQISSGHFIYTSSAISITLLLLPYNLNGWHVCLFETKISWWSCDDF